MGRHRRPLSDQQQRFIDELRVDGNVVAAARRAGYAEGSAQRVKHVLLKRPHVRKAADAVLAELAAARAEGKVPEPQAQAEAATAEEIEGILASDVPQSLEQQIIAEYRRIAFADIRSVLSWRTDRVADGDGPTRVKLVDSTKLSPDHAATIAEVSQTKMGIRVKLHDKLGALAKLAQIAGLLNGEGQDRSAVDVPLEDRLAAYQREEQVADAENVVPIKRQGQG